MLNTWHLVAYQRYYDGLIARATQRHGGANGGAPHVQQQGALAGEQGLAGTGSNLLDVRLSISCRSRCGSLLVVVASLLLIIYP
jgi:hypothetical protein